MKIVKTLMWKNSNIWQLFYSWMTYVVPHFQYGALVFLPRTDLGRGYEGWDKYSRIFI